MQRDISSQDGVEGCANGVDTWWNLYEVLRRVARVASPGDGLVAGREAKTGNKGDGAVGTVRLLDPEGGGEGRERVGVDGEGDGGVVEALAGGCEVDGDLDKADHCENRREISW